jgi:Imelysin
MKGDFAVLLLMVALIVALIVALMGCDKHVGQLPEDQSNNNQQRQLDQKSSTRKQGLPAGFKSSASAQLGQFHQLSTQLHQAVNQFLQDHSDENWQSLKAQWIAAHEQWHLCDFFFAPIREFQTMYSALRAPINNIHSAPVTAGYLDSIEGYPFSGLVNDITVPISAQAIADQHQRFDEEEVAVGLHVIEFFLWGKTISDYDTSTIDVNTTGTDLKNHPVTRRRQYLSVLAQHLENDANDISHKWHELTQKIGTDQQRPQTAVIMGIIKQLQQFSPHSEFLAHHSALHSGQHEQEQEQSQLYSWQAVVTKQWQNLASQNVQADSALTQQLEVLHQVLTQSPVDSASVDSQLKTMMALLKSFNLETAVGREKKATAVSGFNNPAVPE